MADIDTFLRPLAVDVEEVHGLARTLALRFGELARESRNQFLSTPISEEVLRPSRSAEGTFLAIDIGGTNLRVGFVEFLVPGGNNEPVEGPCIRRHLEKAWPIEEPLKNNNATDLFAWIGSCIAEVVQKGKDELSMWGTQYPEELPLGVTFSFPMIQHTLSEAILMSMGKGFAITPDLELGKLLLEGYEAKRDPSLPKIKITAIVNDAVATLVSFAYEYRNSPKRKAAMSLIVGTGCNATIPLALNQLHPSKRPAQVKMFSDSTATESTKITVNTEWSINGTAAPLQDLNFITSWDKILDSQCDNPGFMPFEYMTAGRYLGELGRIIIVDYLTTALAIPPSTLPPKLLKQHALTTTVLGHFGPHLYHVQPSLLRQVELQLPPSDKPDAWQWTPAAAEAVLKVGQAIQTRAAAMAAAATIALLSCADEFPLSSPQPPSASSQLLINDQTPEKPKELMVGYTGGCISHFQAYLSDCQSFLDAIMDGEFNEGGSVPRVVLMPCHDGGIIGAGILAGAVAGMARRGELGG
ncbi:hexokinase family protein-like protein [Amylocarpus encephaloides]|uniref:Phosphotransferase n=1 Tax=Amylocarpus encephaloides TaxID=45428 RepID=A0A9P7YQI1_9HELO|nr:hexokinase family protein-like protein [Amylocarpus encephaloides]